MADIEEELVRSGKFPEYVLVTPAYNEERYIHYPLESMVRQTVKPLRWIIVDDGSDDNTAQVIQEKAREYDWIVYHYNRKIPGQTYYSSNVYAILNGLALAGDLPYTYLAVLDADIELSDDYYEKIIEKLEKYPELGIASGTYMEQEGGTWVKKRTDPRHTPKAIQVFRRECYEATQGYIPFKHGGEDSGIEVMARMTGWKTWSFENIVVKHHRPVGTGDGRTLLRARFRQGITDYCFGTHPLFMLVKSITRMSWEKPYIASGLARLVGYCKAYATRMECQLPRSAIKYLRNEQLRRIFKPFAGCERFE